MVTKSGCINLARSIFLCPSILSANALEYPKLVTYELYLYFNLGVTDTSRSI